MPPMQPAADGPASDPRVAPPAIVLASQRARITARIMSAALEPSASLDEAMRTMSDRSGLHEGALDAHYCYIALTY